MLLASLYPWIKKQSYYSKMVIHPRSLIPPVCKQFYLTITNSFQVAGDHLVVQSVGSEAGDHIAATVNTDAWTFVA